MADTADFIRGDRRSARRYAIEMKLSYTRSHKGQRVSGTGQICDISSGGLCFVAAAPIPVGASLRFSVEWLRPRFGAAVNLTGTATVVRCHGRKIAVQVKRFRYQRFYSATAIAC